MPRYGIAAAALGALVAASALGSATPGAHGAVSWSWPVAGEVITRYRNGGDPYAGGQHRGIDVAAAIGAPVLAATGGTVRFAGLAGSSGLTVSIRTGDGRFDTSYLHLSGAAVREGDRIGRGARIGAVGASGRRSASAPHLHFGVREAGSRHAYRDPLDFLPRLAPRSPLREPPRGGPVPVVAPVRPITAPVRRLAPSRRTRPARRPVRVPVGRRIRVPQPARAPRKVLPGPAPVPVPPGVPALAPRGSVPHRVPAPSAGPGPLPAAHPRPVPAPSHRGAPATDAGPDLGWALACGALLLAAACLGRPGGRASGRPADRRAAWARLRPLLGRR